MLAVRLHDFGDADRLDVEEMPVPAPRAGEVLVRVRASSMNPADIRVRRGKDRTLRTAGLPLTPGYDVAGEVIGDYSDNRLEAGARVFALCGPRAGAHAEVVSLPAAHVARAPKRVPLQMAGVTPLAGLTALQGLRDQARVGAGARLLVVNAASEAGAFAVQIAGALGAHVTGACAPGQADFVKSLGAERVLAVGVPEPRSGQGGSGGKLASAHAVRAEPRPVPSAALRDGAPWDVIFDAEGSVRMRDARSVLASGGVLVTARPSRGARLWDALRRFNRGRRFRGFDVKPSGADLNTLASWLDAGLLRAPVYLNFVLTEIRDAHRCFERDAVNGKLAISL